MRTIHLKRQYLANCTLGEVFIDGPSGKPIFFSVERKRGNNEPDISCIPEGEYRLQLHFSSKFKRYVFALINKNVGVTLHGPSQRTYCYFGDIANYPYEVKGCIALGLELHSQFWGVGDSALAVKSLQKLIGERPEDWSVIIS